MPSVTGIPVFDWFLNALDALGYLIVFGATVFENLFVVGSITPGETIVIAGAFVASIGRLSIVGVWLSSVVGTLAGSNASYWLGRRLGHPALMTVIGRIEQSRIGRVLRISADSVSDSERFFKRHGAKTVLLARFAIGAKNFVPVIAGASRMQLFWFEVYTLLGAIVYTSVMCAIGWFVGRLAGSVEQNLRLGLRIASGIGWFGLIAIVVLIALFVWGGRQAASRIRRESAEGDDEDGEEQ